MHVILEQVVAVMLVNDAKIHRIYSDDRHREDLHCSTVLRDIVIKTGVSTLVIVTVTSITTIPIIVQIFCFDVN